MVDGAANRSASGDGPPGDGRNLDPALAALAGEAAGQAVPVDRTEGGGSVPFDVWRLGSEAGATRAGEPTYYDRPAIKEPVWVWAVPAYFFVGGAAGAAAVLGGVAQLLDRATFRDLVVRSRRLAAAGTAVGSALLVYDLGRPTRFLHMLRVFRRTSPLSVGSWVLAASSSMSSVAALLARRGGALARIGDAAGVGAGFLGLPLSSYTAVLLSNTVVPVWSACGTSLPWLFVASGASSAAALLEFAAVDGAEARALHRFGLVAGAGDMVAMHAVERDVSIVEPVGRHLRDGVAGSLWRVAEACTAASVLLRLVPGRSTGKRRCAGGAAVLGALAMRFAVFHAGKTSARDPVATFVPQRAREA